MKLKIIPILLILTSCSSTSNYIIDPRASKEPKEIIRDKLECRELAKPYLEAKHQRLLGVIPFALQQNVWRGVNPILTHLKNVSLIVDTV